MPKPKDDKSEQVSIRMTEGMLHRIERLAKSGAAFGEIPKSQVITAALEAGLDVLERKAKR